MGSRDKGMPRGGGHHGHRARRDRSHRGHRSCPHPDVEGVHQHPRQEGVRQVREGEDAGQVGHRREPDFQTSNVNFQKSYLCWKIGIVSKCPSKCFKRHYVNLKLGFTDKTHGIAATIIGQRNNWNCPDLSLQLSFDKCYEAFTSFPWT